MSPGLVSGLGKASKLGRCLPQGTGGSAAMPRRIVERNCSRRYTMIVYISMKLLFIGIIINYNRGSFILAVISFALASINIASRGLPIRMEEVLRGPHQAREQRLYEARPRGAPDLARRLNTRGVGGVVPSTITAMMRGDRKARGASMWCSPWASRSAVSAKEAVRLSRISSIHPRALTIAVSRASRLSGLHRPFCAGRMNDALQGREAWRGPGKRDCGRQRSAGSRVIEACAMDQVLAKITVAALADAQQVGLAAGRHLARRQSEPRRHVTPAPEGSWPTAAASAVALIVPVPGNFVRRQTASSHPAPSNRRRPQYARRARAIQPAGRSAA